MTEADMQSLADRLDRIQRILMAALEKAKLNETMHEWGELATGLQIINSLRMDIVALGIANRDAENELEKLKVQVAEIDPTEVEKAYTALVDAGCTCDLLNGYNCRFHEALAYYKTVLKIK
jgi:hypothetical protein